MHRDNCVRTILVPGRCFKNVMHYNDVIMSTMASQITSLMVFYSIVYSGADQRKKSKLRVTGLCAGNLPGTGEFPAQRASNTENVFIWWRHHVNPFYGLVPWALSLELNAKEPYLWYVNTLVPLMDWYWHAISYFFNQCWHRSMR